MNSVIEFISDHYVWFLTITIILLFGIIGYIVDTKRNKSDFLKQKEEEIDEEALENITANSEEKSLSDMVAKSKNINVETKNVELVDKEILEDNKTNTEESENDK